MTRAWGLSALALTLSLSAARADDQADIKALLDRAVKAHGGADLLDKYKGSTSKGSGKFYGLGEGIPFTSTRQLQEPDRFRIVNEMAVMGQQLNVVLVLNGDKGWINVNGTTMDMPKELLEAMQDEMRQARVLSLTALTGKDFKLSPAGEIKVDGKPAVGVRAEHKDARDVTLYFDKESRLLVKTEGRQRDPMNAGQEFTAETFLSDYHKVDGMMIPRKAKILRDGKLYVEMEITEFKPAEKLDDNLFVKP
jgi:hypothetical protein